MWFTSTVAPSNDDGRFAVSSTNDFSERAGVIIVFSSMVINGSRDLFAFETPNLDALRKQIPVSIIPSSPTPESRRRCHGTVACY